MADSEKPAKRGRVRGIITKKPGEWQLTIPPARQGLTDFLLVAGVFAAMARMIWHHDWWRVAIETVAYTAIVEVSWALAGFETCTVRIVGDRLSVRRRSLWPKHVEASTGDLRDFEILAGRGRVTKAAAKLRLNFKDGRHIDLARGHSGGTCMDVAWQLIEAGLLIQEQPK